MLTLVDTRELVCQYKDLFGAILRKMLVNVLTIEISGIFPSLVGALGTVTEEVPGRSYDHQMIRLGNALTYNRGQSPYWEVHGHPFTRRVNFAYGMLPQGKVIISLPPECWGGQPETTSLEWDE